MSFGPQKIYLPQQGTCPTLSILRIGKTEALERTGQEEQKGMNCCAMTKETRDPISRSSGPLKSILSGLAWFSCLISASAGSPQNGNLITSFTNPAPTSSAFFGWSVASVGGSRVLVGAPGDDTGAENAGAAYLFCTNGILLVTLTNPAPKTGASFGENVATVGNDLVAIGARFADNGGAAYLFNTNGTLLLTVTNPNPISATGFGRSVAPVGNDRLLVSTDGHNEAVTNRGTTYLYSTNGTLLTVISDPIPGTHAFGRATTVAFGDKVVIGAPHTDPSTVNPGSAYLFSTNGTCLSTFTNPSPASFDNFGYSVAAVGSDRVLIGALFNGPAGLPSGVAYLFNSNGVVLSTFASPMPIANGQFAFSMTALGDDRLLFGAPGDDEWTRAGLAYLFNTNGARLASFANPSTLQFPNQYLGFGSATAALGMNVVIIGSPYDDTTGADVGAAYMFAIPPPLLRIGFASPDAVVVSWPSPVANFILQETSDLLPAGSWNNVTAGVDDDGTNVTLLVEPTDEKRFYRLLGN